MHAHEIAQQDRQPQSLERFVNLHSTIEIQGPVIQLK